MGYTSKDIAIITEPKTVSLPSDPNFVIFESKPHTATLLEVEITVNVTGATAGLSLLKITEPGGTVHDFRGTVDPDEAVGNVYFIGPNTSDTAENLRNALLSDPWIAANFDIVVPFSWASCAPVNGSTLHIKSRGAGASFNVTVEAPDDPSAYSIRWINRTSVSGDSISGEAGLIGLALDVYTDTGVFPGTNDAPTVIDHMGVYVATCEKTYSGTPLWFRLNEIFSGQTVKNRPARSGWSDTGTLRDYRFVAKVKDTNSYPFYVSNVLYVQSGYGSADMVPYVFNTGQNNRIRLLTNRPDTFYTKGQGAFISFLLADPLRDQSGAPDYLFSVVYEVLTQSGKPIARLETDAKNRTAMYAANTCTLDMDGILELYPNAGRVRVSLGYNGVPVSEDVTYVIRPEGLHTLSAFSFLNRLGGWDSFNFDAVPSDETKLTSHTFNATVTPEWKRGQAVETVYSKVLTNTRTIEGAPVTDAVAEWLLELAASKIILDGDGNYIIIDDFTLSRSGDTHNLQRPKIKYRLSEPYEND